MSKKTNPYSISQLIYKSVIKSLKSKEKEDLQDWLNDESNEKLFTKIVSSSSINEKRALYKKSDKDKVFKLVQEKINETKKKTLIKRRYFTVLKYAASIAVLLAIGNVVYKAQFDTNAITQEAIKNITPGYEKATLVLSDGTTIDLEAHKNEVVVSNNSTQVQNTDEGLVYNVITKATLIEDIAQSLRYNTLNVPIGGMYQVTLPDGTKVWLNSATSLKYPERFDGEQRIVQLEGEAYFEVKKGSKEFIVKTNKADVTVLGTHFNVSSYNDDAFFSSTLVEGKIKLTTSNDVNTNSSVILDPSQRGVLNNNSSKIQIATVNPEIYTAWKEGKFYFEKEQLDIILTRMSRWYNIDVVFDKESLKTEKFTGVFYKDRTIDNLLNMISKTARINYTITKSELNNKYELKLTRD